MEKLAEWYVPSSSVPGKLYAVTVFDDGSTSCTCPSWRYFRGPRGLDCKHIEEDAARIEGALHRENLPYKPKGCDHAWEVVHQYRVSGGQKVVIVCALCDAAHVFNVM